MRSTKAVSKAKPPVSKAKPARAKPPKLSTHVDELFARGYPHLRRLAAPMGWPRAGAVVKKELEATDPVFGVDVPEDVAAGFLCAMMFRREQTEARKVSRRHPGEVDRVLLHEVLIRLYGDGDESALCVRDAVWLFEAFLGTEFVAEKLVEHLLDIAKYSPFDHAFALVDALGYLRWRMPSTRWTAITRPLRTVKKKGPFTERLMLLVDPTRPVPASLRDRAVEIALQRGDAATLRTAYKARVHWESARFAYLVGGEHFASVDYEELYRLPDWLQRKIVAEYGMLHGPHIERIMRVLALRGPAADDARAWLEAHGIPLPAQIDKKAKAASQKASARIDKVMAGLEKKLLAAQGNRSKEVKVLRDAFTTYRDARATAGDSTPDAYFFHTLGGVKWKTKTKVEHWLELAVEAARGA